MSRKWKPSYYNSYLAPKFYYKYDLKRFPNQFGINGSIEGNNFFLNTEIYLILNELYIIVLNRQIRKKQRHHSQFEKNIGRSHRWCYLIGTHSITNSCGE